MDKKPDVTRITSIQSDPILESIVDELTKLRKCHTVILYGSRARGDFTEKSDYDVMGVCEAGDKFRDARKTNGRYVDIFIFPEAELKEPNENHIYMRDGVILIDQMGFGKKFLESLQAIYVKGPKLLTFDEKIARKVWSQKMLERAELNDIESLYRHHWLITSSLEDYFALRDQWYGGSKEAFKWLKINDSAVYNLYFKVLSGDSSNSTLQELMRSVYQLSDINLV